jgi:hypothetical protein
MSLAAAALICLLAPVASRANVYPDGGFVDIPTTANSDGSGSGDPYPSELEVSDFHGKISSLDVTLLGFAHAQPDDVDMLLVGPTGVAVKLMSDVGDATSVFGVDLTLDDGATSSLPDNSELTTGTYKPTDVNDGTDTFPDAPAPTATTLSAFNGTDPNGTWQLYVVDDTSDGDGSTVGSLDGWSLKIDNALHAVPAGTQADRIAKAILSDQSTFVNASFDDTKLNAESTPDGYATPQGPDVLFDNNTATLAGFPQLPSTDFAILTSGDANLADDTPQTQSESSGTGDGGSPGDVPSRGDTAFDITTLRIGVNVPAGANCLSLDYRFLSEEFPEFVGTNYNDAFIAELDTSTWTTSGSTISAPNDFATHTGASGVNVNGVGPVAVSAAEASDTTYDAATGLVTTKTPITPGAHTVILSIFDQGDSAYDSAAFVDNLRFVTEDPSTCTPPFVAQTPAPEPQPQPQPQPPAPPSNAFTVGSKIVFKSGSTTLTITVPGPGVLQVAPTAGGSRAQIARARAAKKKKKALVKTVRVNVAKAGKVKVTLKPTAAGKKVLKKKGKIRQKVRITFTPTGGTPKSTTKTITIKRKVKKK